ncbi:MAG TPA: hypothetical protein VEQ10_12965 [Vicinamibacteria bacterium]|nr:hypothetical protein [Vicinamibacteria bacterium]
MAPSAESRPGSLILVPAVITFAVTLLRLVGELQNWSPRFFSRAAGGGFAPVGISWLAPIFGIYFGVKLARAGPGPSRTGAGIGLLVIAIALLPLTGVVAPRLGVNPQSLYMLGLFAVVSVIGAVIASRAWPQLGRVLFSYALAARIPVAIVMLIAIYANWGTHYDVAPGLPAMSPFSKWLAIGLLPQMTLWIWFTLAIGGLFGLVAGAISARGRSTAPGAVAA